jgi:hypothetical protein
VFGLTHAAGGLPDASRCQSSGQKRSVMIFSSVNNGTTALPCALMSARASLALA